jgi:hypothetical protein
MAGRVGSHLWSGSIVTVLAAVFFCAPSGRGSDPGEAREEARRAQQLKDMTRSAAQHTLSSTDTPKRVFKFHEAALLRSSNPVSGTRDGAVYLWTDHGRPQAVVKLLTFDNSTFIHEWLSLSEGTLTAKRGEKVIWTPGESGIAFREVPDAPRPAESAVGRLRQMRSLAANFGSEYTAKHLDAKPFAMRLLSQPLYRYETDDDARADGALFAFVQSTAPVALVLLESRPTKAGRRWHYAFASMVSGPVTASYAGEKIASIEKDYSRQDPTKPYLLFYRVPVPEE